MSTEDILSELKKQSKLIKSFEERLKTIEEGIKVLSVKHDEGMLFNKRIEKAVGRGHEEYINSLQDVHNKLSSQMNETSIKADIINSTIKGSSQQQSSTSSSTQNAAIGIDLKGSITEFFKRAWVSEPFRKQMLEPESGILTQELVDEVYQENKEDIDSARAGDTRERKLARALYKRLDADAKSNLKNWKLSLAQEESKIKDRNNTEKVAESDDDV